MDVFLCTNISYPFANPSSIFCLPPACLPKAKFQPLDQDMHLLLYICINAECEEECHISSKSVTRSHNDQGPGAREDTETWAVEPWSQHRHNGLLFRPQHRGVELSTNILEVFRVHREDPLTASLLWSLVQLSNFTSTYTMRIGTRSA